MADSDSFGKRLRAARVAAGLSQTKFGELVGATRQAVTTWERDKNTPYPDNLTKIAAALDIEVSSLFPPPSAPITERLDAVEAELRTLRATLEANGFKVEQIDDLPGQGLAQIAERDARQSSDQAKSSDDQRRTGRGS